MKRLISETYPRNITLSQEQYKEIYPDRIPRRITYLFGKKNGVTIYMPDEIALYIVKHFGVKMINDDNKVLDIKDELDEMLWQDLQKLGRALNKKADDGVDIWGYNREKLTARIRELWDKGIKL
jgi:hypothetical protein